MIQYALQCAAGHAFEAWFRNSSDGDAQMANGKVECPNCGSTDTRKALMAPAIAKPADAMTTYTQLRAFQEYVEKNAEWVGDQFATELRAIHDGAAEDREIYGRASPDEVQALVEEGLPVMPLPSIPKAN